MKSKYAICGGLAFSEESDMKKLSRYAKEGWMLDKIVAGGFFYKLRKEKPKDIVYSLDYQDEATEEYFDMFLESGWTKVLSIGGKMHIFSAQEGIKPIYSERESELEKYATMRDTLKKGNLCIIDLALAIIFLLFSVEDIIDKEYIGSIIWGVIALLYIISSIQCYKKSRS
ncbi:DUF2812 domain-containing protein [Clostridium sp. SHJSY1]|uniref:DUF2812 domain-containing protein n=1 Tax=Clostridium sp. SHJSY1 TaxID=2942483 RepID=UPI002876B772|nr:DUF2812 domain-containing protein [Clostridium sp. SHJSY1]MDS0528498.1 DUF2812 domain-containing protein [Clostridium sp. SHJSY1]